MNREIWWAINTVRNVGAISKSVRKKRASLVFASYEIIEFHEERGEYSPRVSDLRLRVSFARVSLKFPRSTHTCYFRAYLIPWIVPYLPVLLLLLSSFSTLSVQPSSTVLCPLNRTKWTRSSLFPISYSSRAFDRCQLWRFSFGWSHACPSIGYIVSFVIPVKTIETKQVEPGIDRYRTLISTS